MVPYGRRENGDREEYYTYCIGIFGNMLFSFSAEESACGAKHDLLAEEART